MDENHLTIFFNRNNNNNNNNNIFINDKKRLQDFFATNRVFKNVFKGVYAMDEFDHINLNKHNKCLIIFNSITRHSPKKIGHWLALFSQRNKDGLLIITFVDSFGLNITRYNPILKKYVNKHQPHIKHFYYNDFPLQSDNSYVCGAYICFITEKLMSGLHLGDINKKFFKKNDRIFNDRLVVSYIRKNWPLKYCNMQFCPMETYNAKCFNCKC